MKKTTLLPIATLIVACCFASVALAQGTLPSPFKERLEANTLHLKVCGKQVDERLGWPPDPVNPGEVRRAVVEVHRIAHDLAWLTRSNRMGYEDLGPDEESDYDEYIYLLKSQIRIVNNIIKSIDEFLSWPPPIAPEFKGALRNLRAESLNFSRNAKLYIRELVGTE